MTQPVPGALAVPSVWTMSKKIPSLLDRSGAEQPEIVDWMKPVVVVAEAAIVVLVVWSDLESGVQVGPFLFVEHQSHPHFLGVV